MRLDGKVALITGAGSGMGRAMAEIFAREGARILAGDWHAETLVETADLVAKAGGTIARVEGNVAKRADCEWMVDSAVKTYGRLDILCNNAGVMDLNQGVGELTDEMWERVMGINLNGPMFLSRKAVPLMVEQGGGASSTPPRSRGWEEGRPERPTPSPSTAWWG